MRARALVLAAHGSRVEPAVNAAVGRLAARLLTWGPFGEVTPAFHHGSPTFSNALDRLYADDVTVVPLMTSDGYFNDVVLPRELAKNATYRRKRVRQTRPVGCHPGVVGLAVAQVRHRLRRCRRNPAATSLVIVGHGTPRHPKSGESTRELAAELARRHVCKEVLAAYLDDTPNVRLAVDWATQSTVMVLPFMMGNGPHVTRDIAGVLGLHRDSVLDGVTGGRDRHRVILCEEAIGTDSRIVNIVADLARVSEDHGGEWTR